MAKLPDWMYRQSAVVPYRASGRVGGAGEGGDPGDGGLEVLLITSRKGTRWVLPKGVVEPDLTPADSAAKEAMEEAGIQGPVDPAPLGTYRYDKWGGTCRVEVFAMRVTQEMPDWPESEIRQREWMMVAEAKARVREDGLKEILDGLAERVGA